MSTPPDEDLRSRIRAARGRFVAMAVTYGFGVFNDSFYRQGAMLLAIEVGLKHMQGWVMAFFTLPYLLLAAPAGWLADRFSKRAVIVGAKVLELVAMMCGAVGILTGWWPFILAMAFVMGLQSCLFSPALNGSIPELYPAAYVVRANARLKVVVTMMILAGVSVSSIAMKYKEPGWDEVASGRWAVALGVIAVAVFGLAVSFGVPRRPAMARGARFPWTGPLETFRELAAILRDRLLATIVLAGAWAWFVGTMLLPLTNCMVTLQFGREEDMAGYMVATELIGVGIGGLLAGRLASGSRWHVLVPRAVMGLAASLGLMGAVPMLPPGAQLAAGFTLLGLAGIAGGMIIVPCDAFVQTRPGSDRRGRVLAASNFVAFCGIFLAGPAAAGLNELLRPTGCVALVGAASVPVAAWLAFRLKGEQDG